MRVGQNLMAAYSGSSQTHRLRLVLAAVLLSCMACGWGDAQRDGVIHSRVPSSTYPDRPFLFVYCSPAYPLAGSPIVSGIEFALWKDGGFIQPTSFKTLQRPYMKGKLSDEMMKDLLVRLDGIRRRIERDGASRTGEVVDAGATYVVFWTGTKTVTKMQSGSAEPLVGEVYQIVESLPAGQLEPVDFDGRVPGSWKAGTPIE